ncbi:rho GTPase-activating protein 15 isoform X2 [Gadus macrocephalus]|uniref:rho GTPase-activating protein 15 isoform X2 n=1 Tax=Gadus macrocephalus TaxID=80720 RepID=UPI0028CB4D38|nr:rho GTPase-activating protein 15 isoform X2 [Gadus macrocephalus]
MLSGSWRRSISHQPAGAVVADRGVAVCGVPSGAVVLEAQYDYNYRSADGRQVCIREGERFILLKKTNADWWQVRRIGAASKAKPLYVPATYVTEVPIAPMPSPQRLFMTTSLSTELSSHPRVSLTQSPTQAQYSDKYQVNKPFCRSMENLNSSGAFKGSERSAGQAAPRFPTLPLSGSGPHGSASPGCLRVPGGGPRGSASQPPLPRVTPTITRSQSSSNLPENPYDEVGRGFGFHGSPRVPKKSCSQWDMAELSRSNNHLQVPTESYVPQLSWQNSPLYSDTLTPSASPSKAEPPSPPPGEQPLQVLDLWEQYLDLASGRSYYVNSITKERSWKPPRRARTGSTNQLNHPQPQISPRHTSHLSLPLSGTTNGTVHKLSPDLFYRSHQRSAHGAVHRKQSMQRAVSSDVLTMSTFGKGDALSTDSSPMHLPHSQSLQENGQLATGSIQLSLQSRGYSYNVTNIIVEPPSPDSSPDSDSSKPELEKAGLLNKTKISEGGRKLRKNWNQSWVVLVGNSLVFFKDPKSQTPSSWKPGNSRPESSVDLRGAQLEFADCLSSKKNVFKLRTVTGNEFLLQSETDSLVREWYNTIQGVIDRLERENPLDNVLLYSQRRAGSLEMLDRIGEDDDRTRTSVPRSASNLENTERKRVRSRLKKLILKRPPLQALQEKGLIKDQVFGCRLEMLCERERSAVPRFVRLCTEAVERRGLQTDGIYRVSGNLAVIQKLRFMVNHERAVTTDGRYMFPEELIREEKLNLDQSEWEDIHVITGALKLFFRELPEPLVPYGFYTDIIETVKMSDYSDKVDRLKCLVLNIPPPSHDTLHFIFSHLQRVLEQSDANRMTTQNVAIVFGPTLMRPERDTGLMAVNMVYQNQAVELMLTEFHHIFRAAPPLS